MKFPRSKTLAHVFRWGAVWVLTAGVFIGLNGCATVPAYEQQLLSKANMVFEDSPLLATATAHQASLEPGSMDASSSGATGCAACR